VIAIFAQKLLRGEQPVINGDGLQTRDYVYVGDVVAANILALQPQMIGAYNIGTGIETDVNTLFGHLRDLTQSTCEEQHAPAKQGEQLRSVLSHERIFASFGWTPKMDIVEGLSKTVDSFRS
jgi:UDP-glucose 4-epimerase